MSKMFRHSFEFLLVAFVLIAAVIGLSFVSNYSQRVGLIAFLTLFYVVVGIWHHHEDKNLHIKQVLEHLGVGLLIFVVLAAVYR